MKQLEKMLAGRDLRSIGQVTSIISMIECQRDFDELFQYLFHQDRLIVMRAADTVEKLTGHKPEYLSKHKDGIFDLCKSAIDKELKWHLALLIPRLSLSIEELGKAWQMLTDWAKDKMNSRIVRVNSIQALFELSMQNQGLQADLHHTLLQLEQEQVPSVNARVRIIRKLLKKWQNNKVE